MIDQLKYKVDAEVAQFRELLSQFDGLQQEVAALRSRQLHAGHIAQEFQQMYASRLLELVDTLPQEKETLREVLAELHQLSTDFSDGWARVESAAEDALNDASEASEAVSGALVEQAGEMVEELSSTLETTLVSLDTFVREEFLDTTHEACIEGIEQVCDEAEECQETVAASLQRLAENTEEQLDDMKKRLDSVTEKWDETIDEIEEGYAGLVSELKGLGDDVATMTDTLHLTMKGTGAGLDVASGSLQDINSVMNGIA